MEKTISTNQAALITCIFTIALKLSALPALMFTFAGNDSYVACLIAVAIDYIGTMILVNIIHKNPNLTFFELLTKSLGKVIAIIIYAILFLYFLAKAIIVLQELHDYFIATLFEELNPLFFLIVLSLIIFYSTTKNFRTIGRVIQILFWPTVIALSFILIFPVKDLQIEKLLPIFEQGFLPIYNGLSRTTFAFGDFMILLPLMGKITLDGKRSKKHIRFYILSTCGFIVNFFVIFIGSFGKFGQSQTLALAELPLHSTTPSTIGKLEWITVIIWTIILLIDAIILSIACKNIFDNIFKSFDNKAGSIVITISLTIIVAITYMQLETIIKFAITPAFATVAGIIQLSTLLLAILGSYIINHKHKLKTNIKTTKGNLKC